MLWQNWVNKRFKFKAEKQLTQKDVLVFIYPVLPQHVSAYPISEL